MLVSAIIPAYNAEKYVCGAIDSVLAQTYPAVECIVVDDGSVDRTAELVETYGERVQLLRQQNKGVAAARNAGARVARGTALAFLDSDDAWLPSKLSQEVAALEGAHAAAVAYCGLVVTDEHLSPIYRSLPPPVEQVLRNILLLRAPVLSTAQAALIRRAAFEQVGGFDEEMTTMADVDLAARLLLQFGAVPVNQSLVLYRQHPGQMHHDPGPLVRDAHRLFDHLFMRDAGRLPANLRPLGRAAHANLYLTVALMHRRRHAWAAGRYLGRSLRYHAPTTAGRICELAAHRVRRRASGPRVPLWAHPLDDGDQ